MTLPSDPLFGDFDTSGLDLHILDYARKAAKIAGIQALGGLTGIQGHRRLTTTGNVSRHTMGDALDISQFNGISPLDPRGKALAEKFARALEGLKFTRNRESGNPAAVLFGFNDPKRGGNHLNHLHMSYRPDLASRMGRAVTMNLDEPKAGGSPMPVTDEDIRRIMQMGSLNETVPSFIPRMGNVSVAPTAAAPSYSSSAPREQDPMTLMRAGILRGAPISDDELDSELQSKAAAAQISPQIAMELLKARSLKAPAVKAIMDRLSGLQIPEEAQIDPNDPRLAAPVRQSVPIPERQAPKANRMARILAALGSFAAPEAGGSFMASALGGESAGSQRQYEDALTKYKMATGQADTQYNDQAQQREFMARLLETNQDRAYRSARDRYEAQYRGLTDQLGQAETAAMEPGLKRLQSQQQAAGRIQAIADAHREAMKRREEERKQDTSAEIAAARAENQAEIAQLRAEVSMRGQDKGLQREREDNLAKALRERDALASKQKIADDNRKAMLQRVREQIAGRMAVEAKIDARVRESWKKAGALKNDPMAQVLLEKIKAAKQDFSTTASAMGKSIDTMTGSPEAASERLSSKRQAVESATDEFEAYIRKRQGLPPKDSGKLKPADLRQKSTDELFKQLIGK